MRLLPAALLVALAIASLNASAQSEPGASLPKQAPEPGSQYYPQEIAAAGMQGVALIRAGIAPDGWLIDPVVERSSQSSQLDELAMGFVRATKLKPNEGAAFPDAVMVPVAFERDTVVTLPDKTCAEFNADLAYARTLSPAASAGDVRAYKLATGMMMFMPGVSQQQVIGVATNLKKLPPVVEKACAKSPEAKFVQTLAGLVPQ